MEKTDLMLKNPLISLILNNPNYKNSDNIKDIQTLFEKLP